MKFYILFLSAILLTVQASATTVPWVCEASIAHNVVVETDGQVVVVAVQHRDQGWNLVSLNLAINDAFNEISHSSLSSVCHGGSLLSRKPPQSLAWQSGEFFCAYTCKDVVEVAVDELQDRTIEVIMDKIQENIPMVELPMLWELIPSID